MTRHFLTRSLIAICALTAPLAAAGSAHASSSTIRVGVANQDVSMFGSSHFDRLKMRQTRYVVRWDAIGVPADIQRLDAFVAAARKDRVKVLLHISTNDFARGQSNPPSRSRYRAKVGALVARYYARGVRDWGVWNEANDSTQETYKNPARAADYFRDMWGMLDNRNRCGRSVTRKCNIVALDLLDGRTAANHRSTRSYIKRFYGRLSRTWDRRARTVGLHNYSDTNRRGTKGTRSAITEIKRRVRNPDIWLTETGGIVKLGRGFPCNPDSAASVRRAEAKANRAVSWMFRLADKYKRDIDRLYVYQWTGTSCLDDRYDYGLVRLDGSRRPGYFTVRSNMRKKLFKP